MMRALFFKPSYLLWIAVPLAAYLGYAVYGLPHAIWSYDFQAPNYSDFSARYYTRCTYLGPYGAYTEYPTDGRCGWVRFVKTPELGQ